MRNPCAVSNPNLARQRRSSTVSTPSAHKLAPKRRARSTTVSHKARLKRSDPQLATKCASNLISAKRKSVKRENEANPAPKSSIEINTLWSVSPHGQVDIAHHPDCHSRNKARTDE